jgi:mono/diheme cytochrome c family protein
MSRPDTSPQNAPRARELPDPQEGAEPAPVSVWISILGLVVFGAAYFYLHTGDGSVAGGDSRTPVGARAEPAQANGAAIYAQSCAACHQPDGRGVPGAFPPLAGSEWVNGDEKTVVRIILLGIQGPITVQGKDYNGMMPPWREPLDDAQIAAVLSHVRSQWGNQAPAIRPETVAALRATYRDRRRPWQGGADLHAEARR